MSITGFIFENSDSVWYHGTPDVRALEKEGGFTERIMSLDYVADINKFNELQTKLKQSREQGDEEAYFSYLNMVSKFKDQFKLRKPIFLTNDQSVARTYADPNRSFDYQNSVEKILKVRCNTGKSVTITATGDRFRFIKVENVKSGFIGAGINEVDFDKVLSSFNFYLRDKTRITTDMIAAIGEWFKIDYIDVVGVLDSYEGGSRKSTVRIVFNPEDLKVLNIMKEDKIKGGLADDMSVKDLADKHNTTVDVINKEIKKGMKVEKEHTSDSQVAKEIAKDHTYESPEYYENLKESLTEDISLIITDETPETISVLVQHNNRNAGIIMITPANAKDTLEIVSIKFKKGYDTQFIITQGVQSLWDIFKETNHFIVAPELKGVELWNKMGFSRITKNYLISNRGH